MNNVSENEFGLSWAQTRVKAFHESAGHPVGTAPSQLTASRIAARAAWMREEIDELESAETLVDQADAITDLMYFALGTLVEMGVDAESMFDIVHRANMRKVMGSNILTREHDGKIQKPEDWVTPETEMASAIVSSYSRYSLSQATDGNSCLAVLDMVSKALGLIDFPSDAVAKSLSAVPALSGSIEPYLSAAGASMQEEFKPIEFIDEASFQDVLKHSLAEFPGVFILFDVGQVYRSTSRDQRYALIDRLDGNRVQIIDPGPNDPGLHSVNIDDLFAGVNSAMDGIHGLALRHP